MSRGKEETDNVHSDIVHRYEKTHTEDAKWLQIDKPMIKLYRPTSYDIGGTYVHDLLSFWFTFNTEIVGDIILFHLFVYNYRETHFIVSVSSCHQELEVDHKKQTVHLTKALEDHTFDAQTGTLNYVTTYSFNEQEVQALHSKTLFISIKISPYNKYHLQQKLNKVSLRHDCRGLLRDTDTADFYIVSDTGDKIPAHKLILKAHSIVFTAMFNEDNQNLLVQQDHSVETCTTEDVNNFLEFMYTGTITDIENCNAQTMLILADKYLVQGLKEFAENMLILDLNIENCFEILNAADIFSSDKIKYATMKFIKQNASKLDFKNLYQQLANKKLIYELTDYVVVRDEYTFE